MPHDVRLAFQQLGPVRSRGAWKCTTANLCVPVHAEHPTPLIELVDEVLLDKGSFLQEPCGVVILAHTLGQHPASASSRAARVVPPCAANVIPLPHGGGLFARRGERVVE